MVCERNPKTTRMSMTKRFPRGWPGTRPRASVPRIHSSDRRGFPFCVLRDSWRIVLAPGAWAEILRVNRRVPSAMSVPSGCIDADEPIAVHDVMQSRHASPLSGGDLREHFSSATCLANGNIRKFIPRPRRTGTRQCLAADLRGLDGRQNRLRSRAPRQHRSPGFPA